MLNTVTVTPEKTASVTQSVQMGGTQTLSWINHNLNPLYIAFNSVNSLFTGSDYLSGGPMNGYDAAIGILSVLPIGKVAEMASTVEGAVAGQIATKSTIIESGAANKYIHIVQKNGTD